MIQKKVQLVLGSGGARGLAHIGVIEELEKEGYEIVEVIGCSMGAVVGGIYCAGFLKEYKEWILTLNRNLVFSMLDITFPNMGFLKGERVLGRMHDLTGDQLIEDLKIPFKAIATDMVNKEEVIFDKGDLYAAMRASMSIPGVFTPIKLDERILVDGAVLNPLPINHITKRSDTSIIAVNLNGPYEEEEYFLKFIEQEKMEALEEENSHPKHHFLNNKWMNKFLHLEGLQLSKINPLQKLQSIESVEQKNIEKTEETKKTFFNKIIKHEEKKVSKNNLKYSYFDLLTNSFYYTQDRLVELTIKAYPPDLVIDIPRNSCAVFDFHKGKKMIDIGKFQYHLALQNATNI